MRLGEHRRLHSTAAGKLFLAHSEDLLARTLARGLDRFTADTLTAPAKLKAALRKVRSEKLAWNRGENSVGAGAVAAPVFDAGGQVTAALSTVFPLHVVDRPAGRRIAAATASAAQRISQQLGYGED
jgi:DNA-binding IclR family transcriptional regulator